MSSKIREVGVVIRYNEEKSSAIRFNNSSRLYDSGNALKKWIRVDGTYVGFVIDTGAEVSIVTEATSRILSLVLMTLRYQF